MIGLKHDPHGTLSSSKCECLLPRVKSFPKMIQKSGHQQAYSIYGILHSLMIRKQWFKCQLSIYCLSALNPPFIASAKRRMDHRRIFFSFDHWYDAEFCQWKALCQRDLSGGRSGLLPGQPLAFQTILWEYRETPTVLEVSPSGIVRLAPVTPGDQEPSHITHCGGFVVVHVVRHLPVNSFTWHPRG